MLELAYIAILLVISGAANAVMDTLAHHYTTSIFARFKSSFWNPNESWRRKYKNSDHKQGPAFPGSTTVFVFLTDAWHLAKFIQLNAFTLAAALPAWNLTNWPAWRLIVIFIAFKVAFSAPFNWLYHKILRSSPPVP